MIFMPFSIARRSFSASIKIEYDYYRGITSERMEIDEKKEGWWFNIDVYNCNELNGVC